MLRCTPSSYADLSSDKADEHRLWRERLLAELIATRPKAKSSDLVRKIDELCSDLLSISASLAHAHGTPDLGNKHDAVDELVYIILSRRTREDAYQAAYKVLKTRYRRWEDLAVAPVGEIEQVIGFSGLGTRKAQSLRLALGALIKEFGYCTLEPTRSWSDQRTHDFLCSLPEVGPKSASCVMMCALDRPAFPVDAHVGRVLERLGLFVRVGIELAGRDHKVKQRLLADAVPPAIRYPLHVNLLVHGRAVCLPGKPRCVECVISRYCEYASSRSDG